MDWRLVYDDDFKRARLGQDWGYGPGSWAEHPFELGDGFVKAGLEMYSFLTWQHPAKPPLRVEFDAKGTGGCIERLLLSRPDEVGVASGIDWHPLGYLVTIGRGGHSLTREGLTVLESARPVLATPDKWQHVVVQYLPPKLTVLLEGQQVLAYEDKAWLAADETLSLMGDAWSLPQVTRVRIYRPAGGGP